MFELKISLIVCDSFNKIITAVKGANNSGDIVVIIISSSFTISTAYHRQDDSSRKCWTEVKVSRSASNQMESFTRFRIVPTITVPRVLRAIKQLHVSLCETAACGWKLTPDSWSVSQQSRTSDPHTFINTVCVYDDLKCQVRLPVCCQILWLLQPLLLHKIPPSSIFRFKAGPKLAIWLITVHYAFRVCPGTLASWCRKKAVRSARMRVCWRVKSI